MGHEPSHNTISWVKSLNLLWAIFLLGILPYHLGLEGNNAFCCTGLQAVEKLCLLNQPQPSLIFTAIQSLQCQVAFSKTTSGPPIYSLSSLSPPP